MGSSLPTGLYPRLLGSAWSELDPAVRRAHLEGDMLRQVGLFRIRHGAGRLARLLLSILHLPPEAPSVATELVVTPLGRGERWTRRFGDRRWITTQTQRREGVLAERVGAVELRFRLRALDGALTYLQIGAALRWGPLSLPLPRWLWPRVEAREEACGMERTRVAVEVNVPLAGLLIAYDGLIGPKVPG